MVDDLKWVKTLLLYTILITVTILWLVPVAVAVLTAFRSNEELLSQGFLSFPRTLRFQSFIDAWNRGGLLRYLPNSFKITIPSLVLTIFLSSLSAYALARFKFRFRRLIFYIYVAGMMLPFQILLLPVFKQADALGWYDTHMSLIAIHTAFQLGFCTFVLRNYMITVPKQIFEAAVIDGCGEFRIYWQIMLPLVLPAFAALATLQFTWIFNDYIWSLILIRNAALMPVTAGLAILQGQYITDYTVLIAGALLATAPTIAVFVFLQRYFIEGLTMGSNK
jgi:multiple sugar transport system permease protein